MFSVVLSWSEASGALKRGGGVGWGGGGVWMGFVWCVRWFCSVRESLLVHKNAQISLCPHFHFSIMLNPTNPVNIHPYILPYKLITEEGYI